MSRALTERYGEDIAGVLSCYDRILITGTLPGACFAGGMTHILYSKGIRIFDYAQFTAPLRDRVREQAVTIARDAGIAIETSPSATFARKRWSPRYLPSAGIILAWCM